MKKELPNVFVNPINKNINNVQEVFYSEKKNYDRGVNVDSILVKINKIFASPHHVYKSRVKITTDKGVFEKDIVGKSNGNLLTLNGENIKIIDIKNIERL